MIKIELLRNGTLIETFNQVLEYANDIKNPNPKLLFKGDKLKIKAVFHIPGRIADMQFANMTILWNDSFRETNAQKLKGHEITFNIDRGMTNGKN